MTQPLNNQFYTFFIFMGIGIIIVLIFDIFRIFRKTFKTSDKITFLEDILFLVITAFILLYSIMKFNSGELRFYIFLGLIMGGVFYILTISRVFIKISVTVINNLKKFIIYFLNIIFIPFKSIFKFTRKLLFKPISFFFINFKIFFTNINTKINNIVRKGKVKKGF